ncbi:MAG: hypothetical protein R3C05_28200 [Pirellulaceae bacterium]
MKLALAVTACDGASSKLKGVRFSRDMVVRCLQAKSLLLASDIRPPLPPESEADRPWFEEAFNAWKSMRAYRELAESAQETFAQEAKSALVTIGKGSTSIVLDLAGYVTGIGAFEATACQTFQRLWAIN